jgi:hypothetical protein
MKRMAKKTSPHVPEQFRGFSLQPTRMALLLLKAPEGSFVSLEKIDDVALETADGNMLAVQTKDTESTNPVSDRSPQMWKTFANWSRDVREKKLDATRTTFELYVSRKVSGRLVSLFHAANTKSTAKNAFDEARNKLWGEAPRFSKRTEVADTLREHLDEVFGPGQAAFRAILERFQLTCALKTPELDLRTAVANILTIREDLIDDMVVDIHGWLKTLIDEQLRERKAPVVARDKFCGLLRASYNKLLPSGALPDLARKGPTPSDIAEMMGLGFVRQMEIINQDEESQHRAMTCFFKSRAARTEWANRGDALVHSDSIREFEDGLKQVWRNHRTKVFSDPVRTDEELRGRLLLAECESHSCLVEGKAVPTYFIPGCFHELADRLSVGWHPRFEVLLQKAAA